ncbi:hypothetical protein UlMin_043811 [Ulmus minor]
MKAEIDALEDNGTWSVVSLPVGKHAVGCKWVFKIKHNDDASINGWFLYQLDVNNAFLHGDLDEGVYITIPPGYSPTGGTSLYGLKQASRQWYAKFSNTLLANNFKQSATDHSLFIKNSDISFSVNRLSQFLANPRAPHLKAVQRVLQYIKQSPGQGLFFPASSNVQLRAFAEASFPNIPEVQFKVFADADWGTCPDTRRSISGFCVFLGDSLISWKSKK